MRRLVHLKVEEKPSNVLGRALWLLGFQVGITLLRCALAEDD